MNTLIKILILGLALSGTALATEHGKGDGMMGNGMPMNQGMGMGGGMMMGMMSHDQMKAMHQHMEKMQTLMHDIQQEKDKGKAHKMLRQHMHDMQEGMHMMGGGMGNMSSGKEDMSMMPSSMKMEDRMGMMQERMNMMQMMMEQMMNHMQMMEHQKE